MLDSLLSSLLHPNLKANSLLPRELLGETPVSPSKVYSLPEATITSHRSSLTSRGASHLPSTSLT